MKWMLFVLVFGSHPVETNLLFDSIDGCLRPKRQCELSMHGLTARALGVRL
jgi:hypothetical protein